jgi:hypothetical protein
MCNVIGNSLVATLLLICSPSLCLGKSYVTSTLDYSGWSAYAASLQSCTPGNFTLPDPDRASLAGQNTSADLKQNQMYFTIKGPDFFGRCRVDFWTQYADAIIKSPERINSYWSCKFNKANLAIVMAYAKGVANRNVQNGQQYGNALESACTHKAKSVTLS